MKLAEQAANTEVVGFRDELFPVNTVQPESTIQHGHWTNGGIVLSGDNLYAEVTGSVVCLQRSNGSVNWRFELQDNAVIRSMVATPEHLVFCMSISPKGRRDPVWEAWGKKGEHRLVALNLKDGKQVWEQGVAMPGNLAIASGRLLFANGDLTVFESAQESGAGSVSGRAETGLTLR
jgi:outer membrane protein assembly factor BamB